MEYVHAADGNTFSWLESHHQPWLNEAMKFATLLGDKKTVIGVLLAAVLVFWLYGRRRTACIVLATAVLGLGIAQGVKLVANRPRPDVAWRVIDPPHSPSFPSGHSLNSMAIYGAIALTASRTLRRRIVRGLVIALGIALPLLIGISRPYLGVHYPSDVLAGWLVGLSCALLAYCIDARWGEGGSLARRVTPTTHRP
ncbi:MAG TPA: phosphatase PAP2 family protein [Gemmataceae bacterium]|nr:phosphatase PAP2 family protein [Gemmataceae bacterium]